MILSFLWKYLHCDLGFFFSDFIDEAEVWIHEDFGNTKGIEATMASLWETVKPLYQQLHAYVRHRLTKHYPQLENSDVIQAHLLGKNRLKTLNEESYYVILYDTLNMKLQGPVVQNYR